MMMTRSPDDTGAEINREQVDRSTGRLLFADQTARDDANEALGRIDSHEKLCTERWQSQREAMVRVEKTMGEIKTCVDDKIGKLPAGIIAALTGVCGYLAARAFPIH